MDLKFNHWRERNAVDLKLSTIRSRNLKEHRATSKTISFYLAKLSTDTVHNKNNIFFQLFFFDFFFFFFFFFFIFFSILFVCVWVCFFKEKVYILIRIRLCRWLSEKKNFIRPISGKKTTFFGLCCCYKWKW